MRRVIRGLFKFEISIFKYKQVRDNREFSELQVTGNSGHIIMSDQQSSGVTLIPDITE